MESITSLGADAAAAEGCAIAGRSRKLPASLLLAAKGGPWRRGVCRGAGRPLSPLRVARIQRALYVRGSYRFSGAAVVAGLEVSVPAPACANAARRQLPAVAVAFQAEKLVQL